jgi:hypothetical protein
MKKFIVVLLLLVLVGASEAQVKTQLKVLFVGNSFTFYNNLPQVVSYMADSTAIKLQTQKSTVGGAFLSEHWQGKRGLKTKKMIQEGKYDVVIIQENSMGAIDSPDSLMKYTKLFADLIRSTGAKPYLYQVWARQRVPQYHTELNAVYEKVAREANISLIPIGKAWNTARTYRPTAPLFDADGIHPSNMGTFMTAAVIVGHICGNLPERYNPVPTVRDAKGETLELVRLEWLDMVFAMKVARETLKMKDAKGF